MIRNMKVVYGLNLIVNKIKAFVFWFKISFNILMGLNIFEVWLGINFFLVIHEYR